MSVEITSKMVGELRERTGAGLMECKKALAASGGSMEGAVDWLRKSGLKTAEKKAGREMGEGRIAACILPGSRSGALVALTCETDFVARTSDFEGLLNAAAKLAADAACSDPAGLGALSHGASTLDESIKLMVGKIGENISIGKVSAFRNASGYVGFYVHHDGKKGAIVSVKTGAEETKAVAALKDLAMHVVFANPSALKREEVPASEVERERAIYLDEVKSKPAEIQEKIISGKLNSFYAMSVLPEQNWFKDDARKVQAVLDAELGKGTLIEGFARFQIGK
jgi:elongation factor Ts